MRIVQSVANAECNAAVTQGCNMFSKSSTLRQMLNVPSTNARRQIIVTIRQSVLPRWLLMQLRGLPELLR